jgi:hypothetical protein
MDIGRRRLLQSAVPALAAGVAPGTGRAAAPPARPRLGINLSGVADWNSELPFADMVRMSREWISQRDGAGWGKGPPLAVDEAGWLKALEPGCHADSALSTIEGGHYPAGTYRVFYDGKGEFEFWGTGRLVSHRGGVGTVEVATPRSGPLWLRVRRTDPTDPLRNFRVLRPGFDAKTPPNAFDPAFLERWRGVDCLRFMDWQYTNNSVQQRWAERPLPTDARFTTKGVALEVMIDLANRIGVAPWFCMPHRADDEYVTGFARLVNQRLDPALKIYVEYSNEVWNFMFSQTRFLRDEAQAARITQGEAIARRSLRVFRLWEQVFGGPQRLVRVLPSQAANLGLSEQIVRHQDAYRHADVLAIAPYLPGNIEPTGDLQASRVERWSVEQLLDHLESRSLPAAIASMKAQKAVADRYGLKLVAYEGGQHLVGVLGVENNEAVTRLLHEANAHPRMGGIYERYFEGWEQAGGDLHCHFNSVAGWGKWGSWGLLRNTLEDPRQSPKFMATMRWARKLGQKVNLPG